MKVALNWSIWTNSSQRKKQYLNLSRASSKYSCHWAPQREGGTVRGVGERGGANSVAINLPLVELPARKDTAHYHQEERPVEPSLISNEALKLCPFVHLVYNKLYSRLLRESVLGQCFCEHVKWTFLQLIWTLFTNQEAPNEKLCSQQNLSWKRSAWDFKLNI